MSDTNNPGLATAEEVLRRYGVLVKWVLAAAVIGAGWITAMTIRVSALEDQVKKLDPMRDSLTRIETLIETRMSGKEPGK